MVQGTDTSQALLYYFLFTYTSFSLRLMVNFYDCPFVVFIRRFRLRSNILYFRSMCITACRPVTGNRHYSTSAQRVLGSFLKAARVIGAEQTALSCVHDDGLCVKANVQRTFENVGQ